MPKSTPSTSIPSYRLHRRCGQAIVTLSGRMFYLGPYGSSESHERYNEVVAQWLANGRCWPADSTPASLDEAYTVVELIHDYWAYAQQYYVKEGQPTSEQHGIRCALRTLRQVFGRLEAKNFTALRLQELRQVWIDRRLARSTVNQHTARIKRAFRWGVSREKVPPSTLQSLESVDGLKKGRSAARETSPIGPVDDPSLEQTLPHLPPVVADMVRLQRLMACRPSEVNTTQIYADTAQGHRMAKKPLKDSCWFLKLNIQGHLLEKVIQVAGRHGFVVFLFVVHCRRLEWPHDEFKIRWRLLSRFGLKDRKAVKRTLPKLADAQLFELIQQNGRSPRIRMVGSTEG